jgi:hypothetical protein
MYTFCTKKLIIKNNIRTAALAVVWIEEMRKMIEVFFDREKHSQMSFIIDL